MSAGQYDIKVEQGSDFKLRIEIQNPDTTPKNLTGYTFRGKIRKAYSDTTVQANFTFEPIDLATGKFYAKISAADTANIVVETNTETNKRIITKMIYDIESIAPDTTVKRELEGQALISPEVTY